MLQKWENKWQMAFNADKCFVIRAGTKRKTTKQDYTRLKSVSFQVGRLCRPGIIMDPRLYLGHP
jgi:hypothetical protein